MSRLENNKSKDAVCITDFHLDLTTPSGRSKLVTNGNLNGSKKQRLS